MRQKPYLKRKLANPAPEKNSFKLADVVSFTALFLTLSTALLYYLGSTYYSGYLDYWGLPEELFSLSREKSVIFGVFAYVLLCVRELAYYFTLLIVIAEAIVIVVLLCTVRNIQDFLIRQLRKLFNMIQPHVSRHLYMSDTTERFIGRIIVVTLVVASPLLLAFVIALTSPWASEQGRAAAKAEHEKVLSGKKVAKPFTSTVFLKVKNEAKGVDQYTGHLIQTSASHCALYDPKQGVLIFLLTNVSQILLREDGAARE